MFILAKCNSIPNICYLNSGKLIDIPVFTLNKVAINHFPLSENCVRTHANNELNLSFCNIQWMYTIMLSSFIENQLSLDLNFMRKLLFIFFVFTSNNV